jgi:hypothetical protein
MLNKNQAESASDLLLADRRKAQEKFAVTIATKFWPFSTWVRYGVSGITGVAGGVMFGSAQPGGIILWSVIGLAAGITFGFLLGQVRRRREA